VDSFADNVAGDRSVNFTGLAFELGDPYCGVDLDNCLDESGELRQWAWPIVSKFDGVAYAEISPSGSGIKLTTRGRKTEGARCVHKIADDKEQIECYDHSRFWTITGDVYAGQTQVRDGQQAVDWLCSEYLLTTTEAPRPAPITSMSHVIPADHLERRMEAYAGKVAPESIGGRNLAAFKLAGHLAALEQDGHRPSESQILQYVSLWNDRNPESLEPDELQKCVASAMNNGTAIAHD
jgi:hypothetical protein